MKYTLIILSIIILIFHIHPAIALEQQQNQNCYPPWSGINCEVLNIQPTIFDDGVEYKDSSTWGGSVVLGEDGKYHMIYSKFTNNCGLISWEKNSECVHGISDTPMGPFKEIEVLQDPFCHNPTIIRAPDGTFVLYTINSGKNTPKELTDCQDGNTLESPGPIVVQIGGCMIKMRSANSIYGPWSEDRIINDPIIGGWSGICQTNPGPIVQPDGKILMLYRAVTIDWKQLFFFKKYKYHSKLFVVRADSWDGKYEPVEGYEGPINSGEAEDPNGWYDKRTGLYHMLYHNFENEFWQGGHAISKDGLSWDFIDPVYSLVVNYVDNKEVKYSRRERPQMFWLDDEKGVLFNGVELGKFELGTDKCHTLGVPVGASAEEIQNYQQPQ